MTSTRSFALDDHGTAFVETQVAEGHDASESDVVSAGLCLLEERARKLTALRQALVEGEANGDPEPIDFDAFIAEQRALDASGR